MRHINRKTVPVLTAILAFIFTSALLQSKVLAQSMSVENEPFPTFIELGFTPIFNGLDLTGWDGDPRFWSVENGVIIGETSADNPTEANTFLIWEDGEPADFELTFYYRLIVVSESGYGNSGVQIRSERIFIEDTPELLHRVRGPQPDIAHNDWTGALYEERGRGALARRGQSVQIDSNGDMVEERFAEMDELVNFVSLTGGWNKYQVSAMGSKIRTWINGILMHDVTDDAPEAREDGILAFQLHRGDPMRVELRNIQLRILD